MFGYIFRRLIAMPVVILILLTLAFFIARMAPGGPFSRERNLPPEIEAKLLEKYHMDESLPRQYLRYINQVRKGDLGPSFKHKDRTVNEIIANHLPVSIKLGLLSAGIAIMGGVLAGVIASVKQNSIFDYTSMSLAVLGMTVPTFVTGPLLVLVFALWLDWLPVAGWGTPTHLILPSLALALPFAARIARLTRAGMLEVVSQDYIRTARAKGLAERVVIGRHALKGGLLPVISFLGPGLSQMLTGSLVVEKIFNLPGIGREFVESALNRDYTLVTGLVLVYGVFLIGLNLVVDVLYGFLDPRVRYD